MSQLIKVTDWRDIIERAVVEFSLFSIPERAEGQCFHVSLGVMELFEMAGISASLYAAEGVKTTDVPTDFGGHYFVVLYARDGVWAIDFTARQFWPSSPFPLIEPLSVYRSRFERVMTADDEDVR